MNSRLKFGVVIASTCLVILLLVGALLGKNVPADDSYRHLAVYTEVLSRIKSDYVEEPDLKSVTLGAVNGLLEAIDPYASYLSADQYKTYLKQKEGQKGNVGLVLSKKYGYISVVDAIPGSPAHRAGLTTQDMIESIQGVSTRDMPLAFAEVLLGGEPGSTVELSVLRLRRGTEPHKVSLTRAELRYPPVAARMLPDQIGYLQVQSLEPGKAQQVSQRIAELRKQGAQKLILDLREAAAGVPQEGFALANLFLEKGLLGYLQGQKVSRQNFEADPSKTVWKQPLVVITNRGSAGGAEVAAAALLESKRAEVVGERTYGDAGVRKAITMDDGAAVILSVAKFYSPGGKSIQDEGVTPTVPLAESDVGQEFEEEAAPDRPQPLEPPRKPEEDALLKKAIEVLTKGVTAQSQTPPAQPALDQKRDLITPGGPLNVPRP